MSGLLFNRNSNKGEDAGSMRPEETAHASLGPNADSVAMPAVVSTPSLELPSAFPSQQTLLNGSSTTAGQNGLAAPSFTTGGEAATSSSSTALSRSNSFTARSPARGRHPTASAAKGTLAPPICFPAFDESAAADGQASTSALPIPATDKMVLELADGTAFEGFSFGAPGKSISGECVFQTGVCLNRPEP